MSGHTAPLSTIRPAAADAGLGQLRTHDLRHTAVTLAANLEAPLKAVQGLAGHASGSVTADVYARLMPSVAAEVLGKMDQAYRQGQEAKAASS